MEDFERDRELADPDAPPSVRNWIADPPAWLDVHETPSRQLDQASVEGLDEGETAAIALAISLDADLLLMDDRKGVIVARGKGLKEALDWLPDPSRANPVMEGMRIRAKL